MPVESTKLTLQPDALSSDKEVEKPICSRDRLLNALKTAPRLSRKDAEYMNKVIREAREGSMSDELHG